MSEEEAMDRKVWPIPEHFQPERMDQVWKIPYQERSVEAREFARQHEIPPAVEDAQQVELVLIDVQNTFCLPDFELFVAGRSGMGAVEDNRRLCKFIYRNLGAISGITATMDTHHSLQIFHALFLVNQDGEHPDANTIITHQQVENGEWQVNPAAARTLGMEPDEANAYLEYYTGRLAEKDRFDLMVWPYHAMLGGIGHALVSGVEEAVFFHSQVRQTYPDYHLKGQQIKAEAYSAVGPEIEQDDRGGTLAEKSGFLLDLVKQSRAVFFAGQAQSHCVAWTLSDLLEQILGEDPDLADKVYLLEDCSSPVVIPDVVDYTEQAESAFQRFQDAGMNIVTSERIVPDILSE